MRASDKAAIIRPKRNRGELCQYDHDLYRARRLIDGFFCKHKEYRGIVTRYDKTKRNFLAGVYLAAMVIPLD